MKQPYLPFYGHWWSPLSGTAHQAPTTRLCTSRARRTSALHSLNNIDKLQGRVSEPPRKTLERHGSQPCRTWSTENDWAKPQSDFTSLLWYSDVAAKGDQPAQALRAEPLAQRTSGKERKFSCFLSWTDGSKSDFPS